MSIEWHEIQRLCWNLSRELPLKASCTIVSSHLHAAFDVKQCLQHGSACEHESCYLSVLQSLNTLDQGALLTAYTMKFGSDKATYSCKIPDTI